MSINLFYESLPHGRFARAGQTDPRWSTVHPLPQFLRGEAASVVDQIEQH